MTRSGFTKHATSSIISIMIAQVVVTISLFGATNVNAQLYIGCQDVVIDDGTTFNSCLYNTPSPIAIELTNGESVSFGNESYAIVACVDGAVRSTASCVCSILVDPSDPLVQDDFCNTCDIQVVSDTEFSAYFDCSNRLVGDCVGIDTTGTCIDNDDDDDDGGGGSTPAPADSTTTASPIPAPVDDGTITTVSPTPAPEDDDDDELCEGKGKGMMSGGKGKGDDASGKGGKGGKGGKSMKMMGKKCKKEPKEPKVGKSTKEGSRKKQRRLNQA